MPHAEPQRSSVPSQVSRPSREKNSVKRILDFLSPGASLQVLHSCSHGHVRTCPNCSGLQSKGNEQVAISEVAQRQFLQALFSLAVHRVFIEAKKRYGAGINQPIQRLAQVKSLLSTPPWNHTSL